MSKEEYREEIIKMIEKIENVAVLQIIYDCVVNMTKTKKEG